MQTQADGSRNCDLRALNDKNAALVRANSGKRPRQPNEAVCSLENSKHTTTNFCTLPVMTTALSSDDIAEAKSVAYY